MLLDSKVYVSKIDGVVTVDRCTDLDGLRHLLMVMIAGSRRRALAAAINGGRGESR